MDVGQARSILQIEKDTPLTKATVERAFRREASLIHPDQGGDDSHFRTVLEARETLRSRSNSEAWTSDPQRSATWAKENPRDAVVGQTQIVPQAKHWWDPIIRFILGQPKPRDRDLE